MTLIARNVAPVFPCQMCGKPATKVAAGYYYVEENAYCDECAERSEEVDMMLPVVNSPRVGVCGYSGPADYGEEEEGEEVEEDSEDSE